MRFEDRRELGSLGNRREEGGWNAAFVRATRTVEKRKIEKKVRFFFNTSSLSFRCPIAVEKKRTFL